MAKRIKDAVFSTKYENSKGETCYNNTRIGAIIKTDSGSLILKLDFIPTNLADGAIMLFDCKEESKPKKENAL